MNTTQTPKTQTHPNKKSNRSKAKEAIMHKSIFTLIAAMAFIVIAPQNAWAAPTKECFDLGEALTASKCSDDSIKKFDEAKCTETMKVDICKNFAPAKDAKAAPAPIEDLASLTPEAINAFVMNWMLMHPVAEAFWYLKTYDGSHQFFTKGMFDQLDNLGYVKKGKNKEAREYFENFATGATSDFELFLGLLDRNQIEKDYLEKFLAPNGCTQQPDKAWKCPDSTAKLAAVNALLGKLKESDRPKAAVYFCKGLKRNGKPLVKEDEILQYASVCFNSLPAGTIAFAQMGKVKSGRTLFEGSPDPDSAPKINDREVEVCHQNGDCVVGTVKEVDKSKGIIVDVAEGDTRVVTPEDLLAKNYKVFVGMSTKNGISPVGKKSVITDGKGHSVSGVVTKYENDTIEATGVFQYLTGKPIRLGFNYTGTYMGYNGPATVKGNSLNGGEISVGWEFALTESWFLMPFAKGGFGYVTGESSDRRFDTPNNERMVGILGAGLKAGFHTGKFAPYLVAEGIGLPGLGVSGGIGTQWQFSDMVALDASVRWTFIPDTGVSAGLRNLSDMGNVRVNGLGLTMGVVF